MYPAADMIRLDNTVIAVVEGLFIIVRDIYIYIPYTRMVYLYVSPVL